MRALTPYTLPGVLLLLTACSEEPTGSDAKQLQTEAGTGAVHEPLPDCVARSEVARDSGEGYSFFVAGHVYGSPNAPQLGMYPPFVEVLQSFDQQNQFDFGFLAGDVVYQSTPDAWDVVQDELNELSVDIYIAPGNHDRGDEFSRRFPNRYAKFRQGGDLFLVLDTDGWGADDEQLAFVRDALSDDDQPRNVFVVSHEVVWWSPNNRFSEIRLNARSNYPGTSNFWSDLAPLFLEHPGQVALFAGDVGAFPHVTQISIEQHCNLLLVATGMGGGESDNFVVVDVDTDGSFRLNIVELTDE